MSFWDDIIAGILLAFMWVILAIPTLLSWIPHDCPSDLFFRPIFTVILVGWTAFCFLWLGVLLIRRMVRVKK